MPKLDLRERKINPRPVEYSNSKSIKYKAFGEEKSLLDWCRDERCVVCEKSTLRKRIKSGWGVEEALTTPIKGREKEKVPKDKILLKLDRGYEAWGITKSLAEWSRIEECRVSYAVVLRRIKHSGWPLEDALLTPPGGDPSKYRRKGKVNSLGELILEKIPVKNNREEKEEKPYNRTSLKGVGVITKKDIIENQITMSFRTGLGSGIVKWDVHNFLNANEGDEFIITISRLKKSKEYELISERIMREKFSHQD